VARGSIYSMGLLLAIAVGLLVMAFVGFQLVEKSGLGHHVISVKSIELVRKGDGYYIKLLIANEGSDPVIIERVTVTDGAKTLVFGDGGAFDGLGGFLDTLAAQKVEIGPGQSYILQAFHQVDDSFVLGQGVTATVHYTVTTTGRTHSLAVAGKAILSVDVIERERVWVPTPPPLPTPTTTTTTTTTTPRTTTTTQRPPQELPSPPLYIVFDSSTYSLVATLSCGDCTITIWNAVNPATGERSLRMVIGIVAPSDIVTQCGGRLSATIYLPAASGAGYFPSLVLVPGSVTLQTLRSMVDGCPALKSYLQQKMGSNPNDVTPIYLSNSANILAEVNGVTYSYDTYAVYTVYGNVPTRLLVG